MIRLLLPAIRCSCLLVFLGGCGSTTLGNVPASVQHLKQISAAYAEATKTLARPPESLEELKPFLEKYGDPATILHSPNDGKDYIILWKVDFYSAKINGEFPVLAYEQEGSNGKRYVLQLRNVVHLTDEAFQALPFPPGHKAP